jgi:Fe-S-cluster containining protein
MHLPKQLEIQDIIKKALQETAIGLRYTHIRINNNTAKTLEATSFLYALVELLNEKGLINLDELDARQAQLAQRLINKFVKSGVGLLYQESEEDKYAFTGEAQADCGNRLSICRAVCCKFPFALSKQDVTEGLIRWEFGRPYLIAHETDGYCVHLDRETCRCTVYEYRPLPCRGFDCHDNEKWRVWLDYEQKVFNEQLAAENDEKLKEFYALPDD